uniref:Uncharacterized protein n=1 Tax=Glossina pallidipes TaxID=7398 RepID=A0A1A9ZWI9_GLOPL
MNFTLASVAASGTSNNSLSTNSSSYARNQNINRFATSLNNNITSIFKTPQNLASALRDKRVEANLQKNSVINIDRHLKSAKRKMKEKVSSIDGAVRNLKEEESSIIILSDLNVLGNNDVAIRLN